MKKKPQADIAEIQAELQQDIDRWNYIKQNGCNDPFWPDGVNMNLKRNHIIYNLRRIAELEQNPIQMSVFMILDPNHSDTYGIMNDPRIPPEVPDDYMVKDRFTNGRRVKS